MGWGPRLNEKETEAHIGHFPVAVMNHHNQDKTTWRRKDLSGFMVPQGGFTMAGEAWQQVAGEGS